jgi:hypothetical protein
MRRSKIYSVLLLFPLLAMYACGGNDSESLNTANIKDVAEPLPEDTRWVKEISDGDLSYTINANSSGSEWQISIMLEKGGSVQTATNFLSNPLIRFAQANLSDDGYNELYMIGNTENTPDRETLVIWRPKFLEQENLWSLTTVLLPNVPGALMEGATGKQSFAIKPPYIERTNTFNGENGEYTKVFLYRINPDGEAKLHAVDGELVQEVSF